MILFWSLAALLAVISVVALGAALLTRRGQHLPERQEYDLGVYRDQLAELEKDRARGLLSETQLAAARQEVERRILALGKPQEMTSPQPSTRDGKGLAAAIVLLVPILAFGLYIATGSPGLPSLPFAERPAVSGDPLSEARQLLAQVREQVRTDPENREAWLLLAQLQRRLENYRDAAQAFEKLSVLEPGNLEVLAALGEMQVAAADGEMVPAARQTFAKVLEADPGNPRARYYAGLALAQDGLLSDAIALWKGMLADAGPEAPWAAVVQEQVRVATAALNHGDEAPAEDAAPRGPSAGDLEAAQALSPEERMAFIRSMVEGLAERLEQAPDDLAGWLRLARSYQVLGEPENAQNALSRAQALVASLPEDSPERKAVEKAAKSLSQDP